jgi:DNA repair protein RAD5
MGLGKTIMLAALILTNRPSNLEGASDSSEDSDQESAERSDASFVPSPVKRQKKVSAQQTKQRQARLNLGGSRTAVKQEDWEAQDYSSDGDVKILLKRPLVVPARKSRATLVVAPVTLLGQWQEELWKASGKKLRVVFYYGASRDNVSLEEELEAGADVVLTRYAGITCFGVANILLTDVLRQLRDFSKRVQ